MKLYCSRNTTYKALKFYIARVAIFALIYLGSGVGFSLADSHTTKPGSSEKPSSQDVVTESETHKTISFNIRSQGLGDALRDLCEQAGLQLLYEPGIVLNKRAKPFKDNLRLDAALDRLLQGSDLSWQLINGRVVTIFSKPKTTEQAANKPPQSLTGHSAEVTILSDVNVTSQTPWWSVTGNSNAFGFNKPLMETPRSISQINSDAIDMFSLSAVEDLLRVVPGVFTTTRFGVQGSVDIRSVPADTYFHGMRRLTLQGHGRSVLAAMDSIEVVAGPASPLNGMGKIGGYVNFVPKSGRSKTGQYFSEAHGFAQIVGGEYNRRELSLGFGGPVNLETMNKQGGYYIYGLLEDSDSFTEGVPVKQKLFQAATSIDDMLGPFRLETGVNYQESRTSGALVGRLTQDLVDKGRYIGGSPLVNLDFNGNGTIGYLEMQQASPVKGNLSLYNQPLQQIFRWPTNSAGQPLTIDQFPKIRGIPESLYTYLQANPSADPTGLVRAQGIGGPLPISGSVPVGMALDPSTIAINPFNPRHGAAYEKDVKAEFVTLFADLVYDVDPDFTVKNQLFFDSMTQYKNSNQPFSQLQDVYVIEDKMTLTNRLDSLPSWLKINEAISINLRDTMSKGKRIVGDYSNHRSDATSATWNSRTLGMTANTIFTSSNENADIANDGMPWGSIYRTEFSEIGAGFLLDIDLFSDTNLLLGARRDGSTAKNINYAGRFMVNTGTAANPGSYATTDDVAEGWDTGSSWSLSLSHQLPFGVRPYATWSKASIVLDGNNNSLLNDVIQAGHIGSARLQELGIKGAWLDGSLNLTTTYFNQGRVGVSEDDPSNVINAYATSTSTIGWQTELKWVPQKNLLLSIYALRQITRYTPNAGGIIQLDARALGFNDVLDAQGNVIFPAEAFLYGGRAGIVLPNGLKDYERKQGNPEHQMGVTVVYQLDKNWGLTLKGNYLSSTCAGRLCLVTLPSSLVFDLGVFRSSRSVDWKLDVSNVSDEHYFRARTGDTLGDVIAQAMPGRRTQVSVTYRF